jgi:hypothetical protein
MFKKISLVALVAILVSSCELSENVINCPTTVGVVTTAISGPTEAAIDVPVDLEISFETKKNCGGFQLFYINPSDNVLVDIITVNTIYDECNCDEVLSVEKVNYAFKKSTAGVYVVKFRASNTTFIEHTITVQ